MQDNVLESDTKDLGQLVLLKHIIVRITVTWPQGKILKGKNLDRGHRFNAAYLEYMW